MVRHHLLSRFFFPHLHTIVRARIAVCCSFFIQGFAFATWCSRIPDIQRLHQLNDAQLGTLLLALPFGEFFGLIPCAELIKRFGSRRMLLCAGFGYPFILLILALAPTMWVLTLTLFLTGFIANLSNTAANTQAVRIEHLYHRSIISLFHGMWSLAGLTAVAFALLLATFQVSIFLHFTLVCITAITLLFFSGGALLTHDRPQPPNPRKSPFSGWKLTPIILWIGLAALGCMVCEGTIYNWSGVYLRDILHTPETQKSYGYFAYMCMMVPMRFIIDRFITRFGHYRILILSGLAITGGLLLTLLANLSIALIGFALIGCGTSSVVPICCSLAGKCKTIAPSIAIAEISMIGFFGFLITPPIIGYIAHLINLRAAFALMALMGVLILLATRQLKKHRACT